MISLMHRVFQGSLWEVIFMLCFNELLFRFRWFLFCSVVHRYISKLKMFIFCVFNHIKQNTYSPVSTISDGTGKTSRYHNKLYLFRIA